ncbi:unnamed protein product [Closterium sp. NIES-65]|nr:unnamed protein product [Closterium sp. NIES-65]
MSHCWCKCEAGAGQCGPKVPKLKTLFNAHKNLDDSSLRRGDWEAELHVIWEVRYKSREVRYNSWEMRYKSPEVRYMSREVHCKPREEIGEDKLIRSEDLRSAVADAVDRAYEKAVREAVQRRTELEEGVRKAEQQLYDLLGPDAECLVAPHALPLQERLDVNLSHLHQLESRLDILEQPRALHLVTVTPRALHLVTVTPRALHLVTVTPRALHLVTVTPRALHLVTVTPRALHLVTVTPRALHLVTVTPRALHLVTVTPRALHLVTVTPRALHLVTVTPRALHLVTVTPRALHLVTVTPRALHLVTVTPRALHLVTVTPRALHLVTVTPRALHLVTVTPRALHLVTVTPRALHLVTVTPRALHLVTVTPRALHLVTVTPRALHLVTVTPRALHLVTVTPRALPLLASSPTHPTASAPFRVPPLPLFSLFSSTFPHFPPIFLPPSSHFSPSFLPYPSGEPREEGKEWLGGLVVLAKLRQRLICLRSSLHLSFEISPNPFLFPPLVPLHSAAKGGGQGVAGGPGGSGEAEEETHLPALLAQRQEGKGWLGGLVVLAELRSRPICLRSSLHLPFESLKSPSSFPLSSHIPPVQQRQEGKGWLGGLVVLAELRSRLICLRSSLHLPFESLKSPSSFPLSSHIPPVQQRREGKGWLGGLVVLAELRSRLISLRSSLHLPPPESDADMQDILESTMEALPNAHSHDPNQKLQAHKGAALPHSVQQKQQKKQKHHHHHPMGLQPQQQQQPMGERLEAFYSTLCQMESAWAHHRSAPPANSASPWKKDNGQSLSVAGSQVPSPRPHSPPSFRHPLSPSVRPLTHSSTSLLSSSRSASNLLRSTTPPHTPRSQRSNRSNRDGVSDRGTGWLRSSGAGAGAATATTVAARSAAITVAAKPAPSAALVTRSLSSPSASMSLADVVSLTHHSSNEDGSLSVGAGVGVDSKSRQGGGHVSIALALAEIHQNSAYFQQIEADVVKHADAIWQAKADLEAFQTTDFEELVAFRAKIESLLQDLTDETQVLQRFEGFPSSKLELLRASASLHSRLSALSRDLLSAVPMSNNDGGGTPGAGGGAAGTAGAAAPASVAAVGVCLDRCERLFDRVRREVEAVERSREEDAKKFAAQRLPYSGGAIERVKAAAVRLSSRLLELSAQESMKLRASVELVDGRIPVYDVPRVKAGLFLLWRCFQFAFRAYNFAGGQDETAEELALTVAKEMEAYPAYMWG